MISMKQRGFYMLATFPFFSLALAAYIVPHVKYLADKFHVRTRSLILFKYCSYLLLIVSLFLITLQNNRIGRDKELIEDIYVMTDIIPRGTTISVPSDVWGNWSLHSYFQRYAEISMESKETHSLKYLLVEKGYTQELPAAYEKHPVTLHNYELYMK